MTNAGNALRQPGTNRDSFANETRSADHLLTTDHSEQSWSPGLIIYHDKCADGIVAAWACWRRWFDTPQYLACNYGHQPPSDVAGKDILIVDFSFPEDVLQAMVVRGAKSIVILDHHKTAQAALAPFQFHESSAGAISAGDVGGMLRDLYELGRPPIIAIFDMERSGARMAWDFAMGGEPRSLVTLAERYDLWRFEPGTHDPAEALHVEIQAGDMTVERMEVIDGELDRNNQPIDRGNAILRWRDQLVAEIAERAHLRTVAGVPDVIAVECPYSLVSAVGHHLLDRHPDALFAAMSVTGESAVTWSLRSHDDRMDVSEVAKSMGGGGHRNAAGFRVDQTRPAALHELISEIAADLAGSEPMWTAGMLADALIARGVGRQADVAEDRDLWKQSEETCRRQHDKLAAEHEALKAFVANPPKHRFWWPGEPDCPADIKAGNGELHTLRCKECGQDNPREDICRGALEGPQPGPGGNSFRKKPVVVEAVRFDGVELVDDCMEPMFNRCFATPEWLADAMGKRANEAGAAFLDGAELHIVTLEGVMRASLGDWVIKGVKGELYPCKPDIFASTYEAAA